MTADTVQDASDRLSEDTRLVESTARRIMDSIAGAWGLEGRPFVPEICSAAQTIVEACGRFGVALEKAALEISTRAPECYIDRLGTADATDEIRDIAADLLAIATTLKGFPEAAYSRTQRLGSIGERDRTNIAYCDCYCDCGEDSRSGSWHQHEGEPCPLHPDTEVVG